MGFVRLLAKQGRRQEARPMLSEIYGWFTEGFDTADLKDAKASFRRQKSRGPRSSLFSGRRTPGGPFKENVRQQWSFSPQGSTSEIEDYQVNLDSVSVLELVLKPDLTPANACATLASWRMVEG
jgi:hypothetical protein